MDRVDAANYVTESGKRKFADKNLGTNTPGTSLGKKWHDGVQESVILAVEAFGIVPSHADDTQLLAAIKMAGANAHRTVSADTTLAAVDAGLVAASAAGGNVTVTLPAANAANGRPLTFFIARTDTSANTLTVTRTVGSGNSLGPGAQTSITVPPGDLLILRSDGSLTWYLLTKPSGSQTFLASGTFTVPAGVREVEVEVWGAGGGSMASSGGGVFTNGGAGGGYTRKRIKGLVPGTAITVTVGAGGAASASGVVGGNGGTSSFGSYCSATGGSGASTTIGLGAAAGVGSGGDLNLNGGTAQGAITGVAAGSGGWGAMGGQGGWGNVSVSNAGVLPGGGAGGAGAGLVGSAGANGLVVVRW